MTNTTSLNPVEESKLPTDAELVTLSTKALNRLLKKHRLSRLEMQEIKKHRRTLKNRGYAANCRLKRETEQDFHMRQIDRLHSEIKEQKLKTQLINNSTKRLKNRYYDLKKDLETELETEIIEEKDPIENTQNMDDNHQNIVDYVNQFYQDLRIEKAE